MPQPPSEEIVTSPEALAACCATLAKYPVIGYDTEFVGEDTYVPELCLVQVSTPDHLYLIDPYTAGPLDAFWKLLIDPARVSVVHSGREEVRMCKAFAGAMPGRLFDLQPAAGLVGLSYPLGYGALVGQILGHRLTKGETLTEWRRRPLTPEQIRYAFDDVRHLHRTYEKLCNRLNKLGRLPWAFEESARLARAAEGRDPAVDERWRKLKGAGGLDRRSLAVARALFFWREEKAASQNRPARTVVRDDLLVEIAKRNPSKSRDLSVMRGLPSRDLDAIMDVVAEARKLPPEECPEPAEREQDPPQLSAVSNILIAVLGDLCAKKRLAVSLTASNTEIRSIVRAEMAGGPIPPELLLTGGWRAEAVLPGLLEVLHGKVALRIADLKSERPLEFAEVELEEDDPPPAQV